MKLNLKNQSSLWIIALVLLATLYNVLPSIVYYSRDMDRPLTRSEVEATALYQLNRSGIMQKRQEKWASQVTSLVTPKASLAALDNDSLYEIRLSASEQNQKNELEQALGFAHQFQNSYFSPIQSIFTSDENRLLIAFSKVKAPISREKLSYVETSDSTHPATQAFKLQWQNQIKARLRVDMSFMAPAKAIEYFAQTEASQFEPNALKEALDSWKAFETSALKAETKKRWSLWLLSQFHSPEEALKQAISHLSQWKEIHLSKEQESEDALALALQDQIKSTLTQLEKIKALSSKEAQDILHPLIAGCDMDPYAFRLTLHFYSDVIAPKDSSIAQAAEMKLYETCSLLEKTNLGSWKLAASHLEGTWQSDYERLILWNIAPTAEEETLATKTLLGFWNPKHPSLQPESFKIFSIEEYQSPQTQPEDTLTCLIIDPASQVAFGQASDQNTPQILFKGFEILVESSKEDEASFNLLQQDITALASLLQTSGYDLLTGSKPKDQAWNGSALFCKTHTLSSLLQVQGLSWNPLGYSSWMSLGVDNYGQWARMLNSADDKAQSSLIQAIEDIRTAKNQAKAAAAPYIIVPNENMTWENFKLSFRKMLRGDAKRIVKWGLDLSGGRTVRVALTDEKGDSVSDSELLLQARNELIQRVNRMGLSEVAARIEGQYLVLDFPGSQGYSSKELIQATRLSFHVVNEKFSSPASALFSDTQEFLNQVWSQAQIERHIDKDTLNLIGQSLLERAEKSPADHALKRLLKAGLVLNPRYSSQDLSPDRAPSMIVPVNASQTPGKIDSLMIVFAPSALQGCELSDVRASFDPQHGNILTFEVRSWNKQGGNPQNTFQMWTSYYSQNEGERELIQLTQGRGWRMAVVMNDEVISSPALSSGLKDQAMVYGRFTQREVARLAGDLKAGSLSFSPKILSEENISPELGIQDREMGMRASCIAMGAVGLLMVLYYGFAGLVAFAAVLINLLIIWAVLQNLGAALTLPGLAGIVLTVGMAVDANVLVFERVREELKTKSLKEAIKLGYERAFSAILDSNLTTILAALILIQFDSGPIKGFAMSLIIGIASSMFTALFMTRIFFETWSSRSRAKLNLRDWIGQPKVAFLKQFSLFTTLSALIAFSGLGLLVQKRHEILGMDFVGGYGFYLETQTASNISSKEKLMQAFKAQGLPNGSYDVRELDNGRHLKVYLSHALDEQGALFHGLGQESERIEKLTGLFPIEAGEKAELTTQIQKSWSAVSGQLSQTMRNQALLGLGLALLGILAYLTVRFEWTFALTGVIALVFDVLLSIGCMGWLKVLGLPMQIDLQAIGAIMTIIGYALNDKIIVFDRIREEKKGHLLNGIVIEKALRQTLSRTLMTSSTTLIVLLVLDFLGGSSLLSFSMIMTLGVIIGTLSSLWFAPWILYKLSQRAKS
jgi:SecD/SecF fusion protein